MDIDKSRNKPLYKDDHTPVDIAPNGDVLFIVGPLKRRVRVYSLILKNASKPFATLLGPQFSEGQALLEHNPSEPVHLSLPEDDFDAIVTIFSILHGRNRNFNKELSSKEVLNVAITADKWCCVVPLWWAAKDWLKCDGITDSKVLWALTLTAYLLDEEKSCAIQLQPWFCTIRGRNRMTILMKLLVLMMIRWHLFESHSVLKGLASAYLWLPS
ncbi:uncharacterized protein LY89DRAFT_692028 [Mollisia scopiformis]|uniref:BTB domain-containing protein n=1 Tax=Mollisia scopiformis TaxID=149040 RepID=A0A132B3M9_MOLSC|nr:uncharacterized protein LY89DRAFT_692028 [Mollisia scopiformis]KUJ06941.1 hypothetical protein LY89DRAFT_692028 [Mollisia scopiformis]